MKRKPWPHFFMDLAYFFASRSTCDRKHVGCVIVKNRRHVIATGYNGSLPGQPHCDDVGHLMIDGGCLRTSHAEASALAQAAMYGHSIDGCIAYVTMLPCLTCFKLLAQAGIKRIVYDEVYRKDTTLEFSKDTKVEVLCVRDYTAPDYYDAE